MILAIYAEENNYWISVQNYDFRYACCLKWFLSSDNKEREINTDQSTASTVYTNFTKKIP